MQNLDELDKQLLTQLQVNNRITAEELGYQVGLSTSAVQRRLKRLRDQKVIVADVSIISPKAAGMTVSCIVDVTLHLGNSTVIDSFKDLMATCSQVKQ
ncbi:AsnC family transcriptional regulator [Siphonobacter sp. SORGH_AS_0500]|uniref:Lrp/AsnC family transcriptional regulator n=2 Tax=unclassified Siphonobacter TaxID=2635712 RepID=UPI00285B2AAF|nr:AsnC family transcriptional regulator [Siphonobacter sp. SORGH_AS_0500]MDR6197154.1 DNA-binding Lrp family transcriptional regulator [Siphonobacter sp. SORGH_AS_0500]